jgi:hypothetical protein
VHSSRSHLLRLVGCENGAFFWLPSVLAAAALVLFAVRQAPSDHNLFNHARELRVALGPVRVAEQARAAAGAFESGLERGLRAQRELTLVDPERLRARLGALLGREAPADPRRWLRGTRGMNVLYCLAAQLESRPRGWGARLEVWEVASEQRVHTLSAEASSAESLGRILADSVAVALFSPQRPASP